MLRKLLLLLLIGFAFTKVNAQPSQPNNFLTHTFHCGTLTENNYHEWTPNGLVNGRNSYRRLNTASADNLSYPTDFALWNINIGAVPVVLASDNNGRIEWDGVDRWIYRYGGTIIFENVVDTAVPPFGQWTDVYSCLEPNAYNAVAQASAGVLPVDREEFSDIKVYPNPSTGFINISNLKENSRVVISNIAGQVVKDVVVGMNDNRIDIQDLTQGFYFVELEGKKTIKLLKR